METNDPKKRPRKEVPYRAVGKRNPTKDISTAAGRRAKHRASDKKADQWLRAAIKNPTDSKGQLLAGHIVKTIAAERLIAVDGSCEASVFDYAVKHFLGTLKYSWGCSPRIASLWKSFLQLVETGNAEIARQFTRNYATAFRWCVAGHIHRLDTEYGNLPDAIVMVETWKIKNRHFFVGVQQDGKRCIMPSNPLPENPMLVYSGTTVPTFVAPQDWKRIKQFGFKRVLAQLKSGKFKPSPPTSELIVEDTLLNVAAPSEADLDKIRGEINFLVTHLHYKPKRKPRLGS